ncbi:PAAR domain-containing protein [Enterobacter ludwigii]|uniref:PAAR domain-containing protein n=1 Tax=Enterobacter ludwigii TaxID=299767 RepID=UPI00090818B4|nr:PAAR domain-containing protein [Enterobacter ludwigii]
MGNAVKIGDKDTGHDNHSPTSVNSGSPSVNVDNKPLARKGDTLLSHGHNRMINGGASSVFIDGRPAARTNDAISCGGVLIGGGSVNIG